MSKEQRLMSPVGDPPREDFDTAGRSGDLGRKKVGLFWNGKPGGDLFLDEVALGLEKRFPGVRMERFWQTKPATITAYGNSADNLRYMAQSADLVVGINAD
jgi:hypothetical protein